MIREKAARITILINIGWNGMLCYPAYEEMTKIPVNKATNIINVNVPLPFYLTQAILPLFSNSMLGSFQHTVPHLPSLVMQIGSYAGHSGIPLITPYSASKSFMQTLGTALSWEMGVLNKPIEVLTILVGSVNTTHNDYPASKWMPTTEDYGKMSELVPSWV